MGTKPAGDNIIPVTLLGLVVTEDEDAMGTIWKKVRLHLEAKKSDWEDVAALEGAMGVTVLPDGAGVLLDPTNAVVLLKD